MKVELNAERLRELLNYDPDSGSFTWRIKPNRRISVGDIAGTYGRGYLRMRVDGVMYQGHRLVWLHVHGRWPDQIIDHIDGNPSNNRLANLREAGYSLNNLNKHRPQRNSTTGVLGVSPVRQGNGFRARLQRQELGVFETIEAASRAYLTAKANLLERTSACV